VITHDTGAILVYRDQSVALEWQSPHERSSTATSGLVVPNFAWMVRAASIEGFVRAGRYSCAAPKSAIKPTTKTAAVLLSRLPIVVPQWESGQYEILWSIFAQAVRKNLKFRRVSDYTLSEHLNPRAA
jgi:hypothetical protein